MKTPRHAKTGPDPAPALDAIQGQALPDDVATLHAQLHLCRAQNADLHRQLQRGTPPPPALAPASSTTGLFPTGQRGTQGCASLEAENAQLTARLAKAIEVYREQEAQYARLAHEAAEERRQHRQRLADLEASVDFLTGLLNLYRLMVGPQTPAPASSAPVSSQDLKRLLALAHPDKWQGQPATALAHELSVTINQLRAQQEGRP
jgi:hypothetical protein